MAPPLKTRCKRGHLFSENNTRRVNLKTGYIVRQCKRCRAKFDRMRYNNNPRRQAAVRARALMVHHGNI